MRPASSRHCRDFLEIADRQNARDDRHIDPGPRCAVEEAFEAIIVEEKLRDGARGTGIDLALQMIEIGLRVRRLRVRLRIGRDADVERMEARQAFHELIGVGISIGQRLVTRTYAARGITTQRNEAMDAGLPIGSGNRIDLGAVSALCKSRGLAFVVNAAQGLGHVPIDVSALGRLLHEVEQSARGASGSSVEVSVEVAESCPALRADAQQLRRAIENLAQNAVQACASEPNGQVRLSAEPASPRLVRIIVSDNGPGIPDDVLAKMWTPFFTTRAQGTGLGLPFVKEIVAAHKGEIEVTTSAAGTRFVLTLPTEP